MKTIELTSKYKTNSKVRAKIDKLLQKNSTIQSNLGSESTQEEKDLANREVKAIAYEVYNICPIFAKETFIEIEFKEVL